VRGASAADLSMQNGQLAPMAAVGAPSGPDIGRRALTGKSDPLRTFKTAAYLRKVARRSARLGMNLQSLRWGMAALLTSCFPAPVRAEDPFPEIERASRGLSFEQRAPFGGLSEISFLSRNWSVNTFYTAFRGQHPSQTKFWVMRRVTGSPRETTRALWADSRSCPAVQQVLTAMERLPSIRPDAPLLGQETRNAIPVLDGVGYTFWNRWAVSGRNAATVELEVTGNVDSPAAEWWMKSAASLSTCWRETPPT
jgi:hypothetical protein